MKYSIPNLIILVLISQFLSCAKDEMFNQIYSINNQSNYKLRLTASYYDDYNVVTWYDTIYIKPMQKDTFNISFYSYFEYTKFKNNVTIGIDNLSIIKWPDGDTLKRDISLRKNWVLYENSEKSVQYEFVISDTDF